MKALRNSVSGMTLCLATFCLVSAGCVPPAPPADTVMTRIGRGIE